MTAAFGRRNRALARPPARPAPAPELVLTPEQRARLFDDADPEKPTAWPSVAAPREAARAPVRRAGLVACAAGTAVVVALGAFGGHDAALADSDFLSLIGSGAGSFALIWSIAVNFANFSANLWLTRKLSGVLGVATLPAYMGLGAALGVGAAWLSCVTGMGDSNIGYDMEALAGAGVAGLYRLLSGSVSR
jgi:hypothetical protein